MTTLTKIFVRDFCLTFFESEYFPEMSQEKPWMEGRTNPYAPYMVLERADGTIAQWYDMRGVDWVNAVLKDRVRRDPSFLADVKQNVLDGIHWMQPIYERPRALSRSDLQRFLHEFIRAYPWIEAMWWLCKVPDEEIGTKNILVELRAQTESLSAGADVVIRKSLASLYPTLGALSSMITVDEFRSEVTPDVAVLQKRFDGFIYSAGVIYPGMSRAEGAQQLRVRFVEEVPPQASVTLQGTCGNPGKVRGTVCRVMGHGDFGKIQAGQILVSPMTMIDFLDEMQRAAAFVTDEGGMLCHAAIVAREMTKPCVVGTKFATKVLHDGDLVEVDAEQGIVRIVRRVGHAVS